MLSIVATLGLVTGILAVGVPGAGAVLNTCRAENVTQGGTSRPNLQAVIKAASPGDTIEVRHRCVGSFRIRKDLILVGKATPGSSLPVLDANGAGRVLLVSGQVTLINLQITGGRVRSNGGGIRNAGGTLVLRGTLVRGNTAVFGGGIENTGGTLILMDSSSVRGNKAERYAGGILNQEGGAVSLNVSSSVRGNEAGEFGGGIVNLGTLTLNDSSSVRGNSATGSGGGIANFNAGNVSLNDSSSVSGNEAGEFGGGILNRRGRGAILNACDSTGVDEWLGAISPNTPDDPPKVTLITCT